MDDDGRVHERHDQLGDYDGGNYSMRKIYLLFLLILTPCVHATTRTAATCSAADVQAQINASANGDTVQVPGGTCTWNPPNAVTISTSHQIVLDGQGTTTINFGSTGTDPGYGVAVITITAGAANNTILTGFTFNGAFTNGRAPITINTSGTSLAFREHHNTFNYTGSYAQGTFINIFGDGPGLVDHNTFSTTINFTEMIHNSGSGSQAATWSSDVAPGGPNAVYFEDNTFTGPANQSSTGTMAIENFLGAKVVFRHNTLNNTAFDAHGYSLNIQPPTEPNSCDYVTTRWYEIYDNAFNTTGTSTNEWIYFVVRGGSGVAFGNTHSGTNLGSGLIQFQADCTDTYGHSYPYQDQHGRGITMSSGSSATHSSPIYLWNNPNMAVSVYGGGGAYIQANRDYFTSASQPTSMTRCESAADVTAGCPVSYSYTPYVYPHPLSSGLSSSVAAPTNLAATIQ